MAALRTPCLAGPTPTSPGYNCSHVYGARARWIIFPLPPAWQIFRGEYARALDEVRASLEGSGLRALVDREGKPADKERLMASSAKMTALMRTAGKCVMFAWWRLVCVCVCVCG
jgi:hypothetical protein